MSDRIEVNGPISDCSFAIYRDMQKRAYERGLAAATPPTSATEGLLIHDPTRSGHMPGCSVCTPAEPAAIECVMCGGTGYLVDVTEAIDDATRRGHQLAAIPTARTEDPR